MVEDRRGVCKLSSTGKEKRRNPYSQDLRERVLRAVESGMPRAQIVKTFAVSVARIKRYLKHHRETGHVKPKAIPGRPARKGAALQAGLLPQLQAQRDARLEDHCQQWEAEHGVQVSTATMSRAIKRIGWTRNKRRWQPVNVARRNEPAGVSRGRSRRPMRSSVWRNVAPTSP